YTRDGNLSINPAYDLVATNTGFGIQGWMATQDPKTGNLEVNNAGTVPESINLVRYLKKHAHQTNNITYQSNLDSGSDERDIEFGLDTLTFKDNTGEFQSLKVKFKKIDAQHWVWSATDDTQGNVANGYITTDADGNITASTVEPAGVNMTQGKPFFTYDPDGVPMPASASGLVNATTNAGNGSSSNISASGTEVVDETISVVFDGGDPTRATSYRVIGSQRGFIGSGVLGGEQARLNGNPVSFGGT
ncbi:MAG TPA: hypothetical protein PKO06_10005, partial [Candidatus Ozemobacteraceae bacterium]|nr:hypothetical protein [Candidatus Ozemobacteraceae bacterium]